MSFNEALGAVIQRRRKLAGLTQEELGRSAGYQKGAGVSISNIERGLTHPSKERFEGIAETLETTVALLRSSANEEQKKQRRANGTQGGKSASMSKADLRQMALTLQEDYEQTSAHVDRLITAYNLAHERARDEFFVPFYDLAAAMEGAPAPQDFESEADQDATTNDRATFRIDAARFQVQQSLFEGAAGALGGGAAGAAAGGAAAYGAFTAALAFGTASTGTAISTLSGIAATNAAMAALGGGALAAGGTGIAGGTLVLASIVAVPALLLAIGGVAWSLHQGKQKQLEAQAKLMEAKAEWDAHKPAVSALAAILPKATQVLDYVALHATHALTRWRRELVEPVRWESLAGTPLGERYHEFVDISAAQIAVAAIDFAGVLASQGKATDELARVATEVIERAESDIKSLV